MKALVGAFNQEKALVGAFSVIVKPIVKPMEHFTALPVTQSAHTRCPGHWQWSVVSNTSEEEQGTRNQEPAPCGHQSPHSSSHFHGHLGHNQMTPAMSTMTDTQARYLVAKTSLQLIG